MDPMMMMAETPVLTGPEIMNMYDGDMQQAEDLSKFCGKENDELMKKMVTREHRVLQALDLTSEEHRELSHPMDEADMMMDPDPMADAMCTPCQVAGFMSDAFYDTALARPLNAQAFEDGRPNWCAEDMNNFNAIQADRPELLTAMGPVAPEDYYNTVDPATGMMYPDPSSMYPPAEYSPDGPVMVTMGPMAPMANDFYTASGFPLTPDMAPGMGSMVAMPDMGMDDMWDMGPGGMMDYTTMAPYSAAFNASMELAPQRVQGLTNTYAPTMTYTYSPPPRKLNAQRRALRVADVYPYHAQQHKRRLTAGTPADVLKAARPKVRSLIEHTVGGSEGHELFAHKRRTPSYRRAMEAHTLNRRLQ
jgi:hypothetical protein